MSRLSSQRFQKASYDENRNYDTFGNNFDRFEEPQKTPPQIDFNEFHATRSSNSHSNSENIRLYITIRKTQDSVGEYKKLILMTSGKIFIEIMSYK